MSLCDWVASSVEYGRKLVSSGIEGASRGQAEFLRGEPLAPYLRQAVRGALPHAAVGAWLGTLGACLAGAHKPVRRAIGFGLLGGAVGFGLGLAWETQRLTSSIGGRALGEMNAVRDEHWLENHPIDYA